jgi:prepilin-type processing-associated H-X9-DG protein
MSQPATPPPLPAPGAPPAKTSALAVTSLVLGVFGCACLPAIAGLICGLMALSRISKSHGRLRGKGLAIAGIIVSAVMALVSIPILAGLLLPAISRAQSRGMVVTPFDGGTATACENNLTTLGVAVRIYAGDHNGQFPPDWQTASNEIGELTLLLCPDDSQHTAAASWAGVGPQNISYQYQGAGAANADTNRVIAECTRHGHVLFGDGHVGTRRGGR